MEGGGSTQSSMMSMAAEDLFAYHGAASDAPG